MKLGGILAGATALASLVLGTSQAAAACWAPRAIEAAKVRDFETMLMVATLRCQIKGVDLTGDYNRFIRDKRAVLIGINDELRAKFEQQGLRGKAVLDAYDRFVTSLANAYGAGTDGMECADFKSLMGAANETAAERSALVALAVRAGVDPVRSSEECVPSRIALAR